jgi:hypothetical protein
MVSLLRVICSEDVTEAIGYDLGAQYPSVSSGVPVVLIDALIVTSKENLLYTSLDITIPLFGGLLVIWIDELLIVVAGNA